MKWPTLALEEIALVQRGKFSARPRNDPRYYGGNIPFIQTGDVANSAGRVRSYSQTLNDKGLAVSKLFPKGSLAITIAANIGDVARVDFDFACPDSLVVIQPNKDICISWLMHCLQSKKEELKSFAPQNAQKNINLEVLRPLPIDVPSEREQQRIADVLDSWDTAIEKTERLIAAKEQRLNSLYQRLFGYASHTRSGWRAFKLSDLLASRNEYAVPSKKMPLYSLTIEDGVTPKTARYDREFLVKDAIAKQYAVVHPGDIVFNPSNLRWGAIARAKIDNNVVVSPIYEVLKVHEDKVNGSLLGHVLSCPRQIAYFATKTEGTLIERMAVKLDAFLHTTIYLPASKDDQTAVAALLGRAVHEIELHKAALALLKEQKRGLMQKLLTGQWRMNVPKEAIHG